MEYAASHCLLWGTCKRNLMASLILFSIENRMHEVAKVVVVYVCIFDLMENR